MAVWLHTRLVGKLSQKVCPIYISLHAVSNVFFFSTMVRFGGLATSHSPCSNVASLTAVLNSVARWTLVSSVCQYIVGYSSLHCVSIPFKLLILISMHTISYKVQS